MISLLPDFVIDQIAAGEVLEHPASAVKELVENALDAKATQIVVEIEGGGLHRISVDDNGTGMSRQDALLCLKRHATSKIRSAEDLQTLHTMGFRGEALAAIASVSQLELRTSNGVESTRLTEQTIEPCARNQGTTIEARSLFFNTPARLKFQKSPSACAAAVLKTLQTLSLAHPHVGFQLFSNGKLTFSCTPSTWQERAEEILGRFEHVIRFTSNGIEVLGLLGKPEEAKANRSGQTLFVNDRPIVSPLVSRAVKEGFATRIGESLFPLFILFLKMPPDAVDVNVHPQKREVRFRDEGKLYNVVRQAVEQALSKEDIAIAPMPWEFTPAIQTPFVLYDAPAAPIQPLLPLTPTKGKGIALIGDFLLVEDRPWRWIDLRGAEARILFENMGQKTPALQPLLWPHELTLAPTDSAEEIADLLRDVGIEARALAKRKLAIDALPVGMETSYIEPFIQQFSTNKTERRLAASLTRVCRASSRTYSFEEACSLWKKLETCADKLYDPLGKKINVPITEDHLAELFE